MKWKFKNPYPLLKIKLGNLRTSSESPDGISGQALESPNSWHIFSWFLTLNQTTHWMSMDNAFQIRMLLFHFFNTKIYISCSVIQTKKSFLMNESQKCIIGYPKHVSEVNFWYYSLERSLLLFVIQTPTLLYNIKFLYRRTSKRDFYRKYILSIIFTTTFSTYFSIWHRLGWFFG